MNIGYRGFDPQRDAPWFLDHMYIPQTSDARGFIAEDEATGERMAAVVFDHWSPNSVQMHQIIVNPLVFRHGWAHVVTDYVFNTSKRGVLYGFVASDNVKAMRFYRHVCGPESGRLPDAVREGVDSVMFHMRREDCRFCDVSERKAA